MNPASRPFSWPGLKQTTVKMKRAYQNLPDVHEADGAAHGPLSVASGTGEATERALRLSRVTRRLQFLKWDLRESWDRSIQGEPCIISNFATRCSSCIKSFLV